jgi:nucleoside-diphosphate-sugar epimerase
MRVFVAGATGAVGRPLVTALLAAGYSVVGLTRSPLKAASIRELGTEPVVADGLDARAIRSALASTKPDVVIHQMTDLRGAADLRRFDRSFSTSNRLRTLGTDALLTASREIGVKRMIAQSFCGWPYARVGTATKTETDALDCNPPRELRRILEAIQYLERVVTTSVRPEGVVLRYGAFYGPDTGTTDSRMIDQVRHRRVPVIGGGGGSWSFVHVQDAAAATVKAVTEGRPGQIYNIVDDDPAKVAEWLPALAAIVGARPPFRLSAWIARLLVGDHLVAMMTEARAGSNAKAKRELDWRPTHSSRRQGFAKVAGRLGDDRFAA